LNQAVAELPHEFRAYAEIVRHEAANVCTETLNYLWFRVADHWDQLAQRTEKNLTANTLR
jgi:hypothetical protein